MNIPELNEIILTTINTVSEFVENPNEKMDFLEQLLDMSQNMQKHIEEKTNKQQTISNPQFPELNIPQLYSNKDITIEKRNFSNKIAHQLIKNKSTFLPIHEKKKKLENQYKVDQVLNSLKLMTFPNHTEFKLIDDDEISESAEIQYTKSIGKEISFFDKDQTQKNSDQTIQSPQSNNNQKDLDELFNYTTIRGSSEDESTNIEYENEKENKKYKEYETSQVIDNILNEPEYKRKRDSYEIKKNKNHKKEKKPKNFNTRTTFK